MRQLASELVSRGQLTVSEVSARVNVLVQASRHHANQLRQTLEVVPDLVEVRWRSPA